MVIEQEIEFYLYQFFDFLDLQVVNGQIYIELIFYFFFDKELLGIILQLKFLFEIFNSYFIEQFLYCYINEKLYIKGKVLVN